VELNANGSLRRIDCGDIIVNLFPGSEIEGGPANIYLRRHGAQIDFIPLLGPRSPTRFSWDPTARLWRGDGQWDSVEFCITFSLADEIAAWFWQVSLRNGHSSAQQLDLIYAQDIALAPYGAVRLNEYYVSQYVDHSILEHQTRGVVVASRQNLAAMGRHPWCAIGSLNRGVAFATDGLQLHDLALRSGSRSPGLASGLPGRRLQHEHSMVAIQDAAVTLEPGGTAAAGFFGCVLADHPAATSSTDLEHVDRVLALPLGKPLPSRAVSVVSSHANASAFTAAPLLATADLDDVDIDGFFGRERRHEERDNRGRLLSFFAGKHRHVVLRAKELHVTRPHGHLLRTGRHATPDERALTSTVWMSGVFNSLLTQGNVSFNRCLSTVRGYLGLFRGHGQRVFVELQGRWLLLDLPSAFEIMPDAVRWIYRHPEGVIEVRTTAHHEPHSIAVSLRVLVGEPVRFFITHHVALDGDDGNVRQPATWERRGNAIVVRPGAGSDSQRRFPTGGFIIAPGTGTQFESVGGDELLYADRRSRQEPYLCVVSQRTTLADFQITAELIVDGPDIPDDAAPSHKSLLLLTPPANSSAAEQVERLADIVPWLEHNAFVHYLSPRGLEQYTGGGWGTRDVTQGPVELLLATGRTSAIRDLLIRVMRAQRSDGDWPQWFMFFERDRDVRAGDSHGDIVFWPVLALAQYLIASADASLLEERVPFFETKAGVAADLPTVWMHVTQALDLIRRRVVTGTALAAYGHGDWNDALQPADPAMREHMCSAWTVTLHHQTLTTLARALRTIGRAAEAPAYEAWARDVRRDFQRVLLVDGVLAGYALFDSGASVRYLLHPRDEVSGVRYSSLAMIHAVLEDMLSPEQARAHLGLMGEHLLGPDGIRLFDRPMAYHGGPQRFFQRAESATFFGREIGLMYMHAHLRYAQALARLGEADRFFKALCQANPIGIRALVPTASLRQANCYYSSSDAAFEDRYQASEQYDRVREGRIALDGGWRVYSSGAGIALGLIVRRFLGLDLEADALVLDPVMPPSLSGLKAELTLLGIAVEVRYEVKAKGCGVSAISVNDTEVRFSREPNPYRVGAARIAIVELRALLTRRHNVLAIVIG